MNVAFHLQTVDLYRSSANEFIIDGNSLIPPFNSIPGLGTNAAFNIVKATGRGRVSIKRRSPTTRKGFKNDFGISRSTRLSWIFTRSESVILVLRSKILTVMRDKCQASAFALNIWICYSFIGNTKDNSGN